MGLAYNRGFVRRATVAVLRPVPPIPYLPYANAMNASSTRLRRLILLASVVVWAAVCGVALAQEAEGGGGEGGGGGGGGGGAQAYVLPYTIVILGVGLGLLFVCRSAHRRERPKGEQYEATGAVQLDKGTAVPVISLGMRMDQVNKLLGKPKIARRGADIYRELAQAGKLSEDDAAKEYLIYEHPAGRYELVAFDRRVIEIRKQPKHEDDEGAS